MLKIWFLELKLPEALSRLKTRPRVITSVASRMELGIFGFQSLGSLAVKAEDLKLGLSVLPGFSSWSWFLMEVVFLSFLPSASCQGFFAVFFNVVSILIPNRLLHGTQWYTIEQMLWTSIYSIYSIYPLNQSWSWMMHHVAPFCTMFLHSAPCCRILPHVEPYCTKL